MKIMPGHDGQSLIKGAFFIYATLAFALFLYSLTPNEAEYGNYKRLFVYPSLGHGVPFVIRETFFMFAMSMAI